MINALIVAFVISDVAGVSSIEMRDIVAARLAATDHLSVNVTHSIYIAAGDTNPLDSANWQAVTDPGQFEHRVTIVRPSVLDEFLTQRPERGYEPVAACVADGTYTSVQVMQRGRNTGMRLYNVVREHVAAGVFRWCPILHAFDVQLQDSTIPQLNLVALFDSYEVTLLGGSGENSSYEVRVPMAGYTVHYDFDMDERGTAFRFRTVYELQEQGAFPVEVTSYVLATTELHGAPFPTEVLQVIQNPNTSPDYGINHLLVTGVEHRPELCPSDAQIVIDPRSATVRETNIDGTSTVREYDAGGALIREESFFLGPAPVVANAAIAPRESGRWRMLIPPLAAALGIASALLVLFVSRPRTTRLLPTGNA